MVACVVCQGSATLFCHNDAALLCAVCDTKIHGSNVLASRHSRVRLCELCTKAPATVYCKNDKAFLCADCDTEVHLNNALFARHELIPAAEATLTMLGSNFGQVKSDAFGVVPGSAWNSEASSTHVSTNPEIVEPAPLDTAGSVQAELSAMDRKTSLKDNFTKSVWGKELDMFEMDTTWLDRLDMGFDFSEILKEDPDMADGLVPTLTNHSEADRSILNDGMALPANKALVVQPPPPTTPSYTMAQNPQPPKTVFEALPAGGLSLAPNSSMDGIPSTAPASEGSETDADRDQNKPFLTREMRVARYLEKKKRRKFQKTIRYESRKAYAEIRPRIKGRFAKKEELMAWKAAERAMQSGMGQYTTPRQMV